MFLCGSLKNTHTHTITGYLTVRMDCVCVQGGKGNRKKRGRWSIKRRIEGGQEGLGETKGQISTQDWQEEKEERHRGFKTLFNNYLFSVSGLNKRISVFQRCVRILGLVRKCFCTGSDLFYVLERKKNLWTILVVVCG